MAAIEEAVIEAVVTAVGIGIEAPVTDTGDSIDCLATMSLLPYIEL